MEMETHAIDGVTVLYCRGRFTHRDEGTPFSRKIAELLPYGRRLVVDLSGVEFVDGAGLGELVIGYMWIRASGCSLKLAGVSPGIRRLLERTNLLSLFDVHSTLCEALLAFQQKKARTKAEVQVACYSDDPPTEAPM